MARPLQIAVAVFFGGVVGSALRLAIGELLVSIGWSAIAPVLVANLLGALCLGWFAERARHAAPWTTPTVAFVGVGILGSFTTFAAFSVESIDLFRSGSWALGFGYVSISLVGGVLAARQGRMFASAP